MANKGQATKKEEKVTEITVQEPKSTALALVDVAGDAEQYRDEYKQSDLALPFLQIIQSNSPQIKPGDAKHIKGASMGMILQTVSGELFNALEQPMHVIPCAYIRQFVEWRPRSQGGGIIAAHDEVSGEKLLATTTKGGERGTRDILPNGNELVDTHNQFFLIVKEDGGFEPVLFPLTSTQLKKSKNLNSQLAALQVVQNGKTFRPARFYASFKLKTVLEVKDAFTFYGVKFEMSAPTLELPNGVELYNAAKQFRDAVTSGAVKVKLDETQEETTGSENTPF